MNVLKKLVLCLSVMGLSVSAFALTEVEKENFAAEVAEMGFLKKSASLTLSTAALVTYCPVGAALTGISTVADTVPVVAGAQAIVMVNGVSEEREKDWKLGYETVGGIPAIIADLFSAGYDMTDLQFDEPVIDEIKSAYAESIYTAEKAFGESGYCIDQWQQLGILLFGAED